MKILFGIISIFIFCLFVNCPLPASAEQFNTSNGTNYGGNDSAFKIYWDSTNDVMQLLAAPVGTAGNAITWINGLSLDTSGKVGIGTQSPAATLHVDGEAIIGNSGLACAAGTEGALRYNSASKSLELCNGTAWGGLSDVCSFSGIAPGTVCNDGSVYAGNNPTTGVPMFVPHCDQGMSWDGATCVNARATLAWNDGQVNYVDTSLVNCTTIPACGTDGSANTAALITEDSNSVAGGQQPHTAAQSCADLVLHGHSDWYLPSLPELNVLFANKVGIGGFETSATPTWYWSSSERVNTSANAMRFDSGGIGNSAKTSGFAVRCVRR